MTKIATFNPNPNITPYEVALVLRAIISGLNHTISEPQLKFLGDDSREFEQFTEQYADVLRHFEISDELPEVE